MKKRSRRTITVSIAIISLGLLFYFFVQTFSDNLLFFRSPSQINQTEFPQGYIFRVGGMVKNESIERSRDSTWVNFVITDYSEEIKVNYKGILPDLFREGQGVVVRGFLNEDGTFTAEEVLAKHDETYMPPEVADSLQEKNTSYDQTTKSLRFDWICLRILDIFLSCSVWLMQAYLSYLNQYFHVLLQTMIPSFNQRLNYNSHCF